MARYANISRSSPSVRPAKARRAAGTNSEPAAAARARPMPTGKSLGKVAVRAGTCAKAAATAKAPSSHGSGPAIGRWRCASEELVRAERPRARPLTRITVRVVKVTDQRATEDNDAISKGDMRTSLSNELHASRRCSRAPIEARDARHPPRGWDRLGPWCEGRPSADK